MSDEPIKDNENIDEEVPKAETVEVALEVESTHEAVESAVVQQVQADQVTVSSSLVGSVTVEGTAEVDNSVILSMATGGNLDFHEGGAGIVSGGNDVSLQNGGAAVMIAGGDMEIENGGGQWLVAGGNVKTKKSFIAVLIAGGDTEFSEDSKVLLNTPQAIAFGAAFGALFGLVQFLLRRKKR